MEQWACNLAGMYVCIAALSYDTLHTVCMDLTYLNYIHPYNWMCQYIGYVSSPPSSSYFYQIYHIRFMNIVTEQRRWVCICRQFDDQNPSYFAAMKSDISNFFQLSMRRINIVSPCFSFFQGILPILVHGCWWWWWLSIFFFFLGGMIS